MTATTEGCGTSDTEPAPPSSTPPRPLAARAAAMRVAAEPHLGAQLAQHCAGNLAQGWQADEPRSLGDLVRYAEWTIDHASGLLGVSVPWQSVSRGAWALALSWAGGAV